jgi:hypothetical protein
MDPTVKNHRIRISDFYSDEQINPNLPDYGSNPYCDVEYETRRSKISSDQSI